MIKKYLQKKIQLVSVNFSGNPGKSERKHSFIFEHNVMLKYCGNLNSGYVL